MSEASHSDNPSKEADEFGLINWIRGQTERPPEVPVGIGDDCAALRIPPGRTALVTTDMLIAGVHFRPEEVKPRQVGHKAVARGLSDIAAMAGDALAVVVAMALPKSMSVSYLQELFMGMKSVADRFGVAIIGGDIATGDLPLTLTVTAIGAGEESSLALRSGARVRDMVLVTGELGGTMLGRHLSFLPRIEEAQWLSRAVALHGMIDISDGLAADAGHIASESRVAIELWADAIPISRDAMTAAVRVGGTALEHALHDGEDYELLFVTGAKQAAELVGRADLPVPVTCIGEVVAGAGLWLREKGGKRQPLEPRGWTHKFQ